MSAELTEATSRAVAPSRRARPSGSSPSSWPMSFAPIGYRRRPLLRRPRCRFAADGAVLRAGAQARRPAGGLDQGHLSPSDDRRTSRRAPKINGRPSHVRRSRSGDRLDHSPTGATSSAERSSSSRSSAMPTSGRCSSLGAPRGSRRARARSTSTSARWRSGASRSSPSRPFRSREVGPRRPLERDESGSGASPTSASGSSRRSCATNPLVLFAARRCTSSTCARSARTSSGRRDPLAPRPGLHRPADDRRGRGRPQGLLLQLLPRGLGRDRDRPGGDRRRRIRRRGDGARHRDSLGDGAQLGHSSSLHSGEAVPTASAARARRPSATEDDYRGVEAFPRASRGSSAIRPRSSSSCSRFWPARRRRRDDRARGDPGARPAARSAPAFASSSLYLAALAASARRSSSARSRSASPLALTIPRLLNLAVEPDRAYPLYGWRWAAHRAITRLTNIRLFPRLLGDSSYIVHYLRWLGYDLSEVEQTGSNFGLEVKHETPFLATVGTGTMAADGLSIVNAEISSSSFRVSRATIGARRSSATTSPTRRGAAMGDNCLLATKVAVPNEGEAREDTGLLGSPSFEIPRSVERDGGSTTEARPRAARRLRRKNRHNAGDHGLYLLSRLGYISASSCSRSARRASTAPPTRRRSRSARRSRSRSRPPTSRWSSGRRRPSARSSPGTARSTTRTSGGTSATGSSPGSRCRSTARRSRRSRGG